MQLWQGDVPEYTGIFTVLILIYSLINILTNPIWTLALAVGKLKKYICVGSSVFMLIFPISYLVLKVGALPYSVMVVMIVIRSIYLFVVLKIIKEYIEFTFVDYCKRVLFPIFRLVITAVPLMFCINYSISNVWGLLPNLFVQVILLVVLTFYVAMDKKDRETVTTMQKNFFKKLHK